MKNKQKIQSNNYAVDPKSMIQTFDLMKIYNITEGIEIRALDMVNININKGEFVSVMGPSGSGKTTLLNMIGALDNPSGGAVFINGTDIAYMNDNMIIKEHI
ncbi:MAG: ATP-binding cassette domain-containing protein [Promethearchaeota archaeon]